MQMFPNDLATEFYAMDERDFVRIDLKMNLGGGISFIATSNNPSMDK